MREALTPEDDTEQVDNFEEVLEPPLTSRSHHRRKKKTNQTKEIQQLKKALKKETTGLGTKNFHKLPNTNKVTNSYMTTVKIT